MTANLTIVQVGDSTIAMYPCAGYCLHRVRQYLFSRVKSVGFMPSLKQVQTSVRDYRRHPVY